jgi:CBS domain-containing protein
MKRRTVKDVMTTDVVTVTEDTPFTEIAETLAEHRISAVPVLNRDGCLVRHRRPARPAAPVPSR